MCVQSRPTYAIARGSDGPPGAAARDEVEEDDHEDVRGRERAEEGRDEPADRVLLVTRVQDPVLRQAGEAAVDEPELFLVPAGHPRVAPPLERDEVDVGEAPDRQRHRDAGESEREAPPGGGA